MAKEEKDKKVKVEVEVDVAGTEEETKEATEETEAEASEESKEESGDETEEKKESSDKRDAIIEELKDKVTRQMAEFENFRKRSEKEKAAMHDMGAISVLEKILPVIDNFERGLDSAGDDAFSEGMKMIYKQLMTSLDDMGVRLIPAVGETFDPELHNAVMHEENDEAGESEITQELQKGYAFHDTVIRHSMVKVAN